MYNVIRWYNDIRLSSYLQDGSLKCFILEEKMYNKVDTNLNFVDREKQVREVLERSMTSSRKVMEQRKQGETYTFYDGPPTANGKPHIGHV